MTHFRKKWSKNIISSQFYKQNKKAAFLVPQPYKIKHSIDLYNLMRSTRIIINNHLIMQIIYAKVGENRKKVIFSDFGLHYLPD